MSAPAFHKIDRDAVEAMAPGDVWTWTTHRGFVAEFHPDYADGKMFVTEALSGTTHEYQVDRVSVGTARRNGVCRVLIYSADEQIRIDGVMTDKQRFVGAASVRGASGNVVGKRVWL